MELSIPGRVPGGAAFTYCGALLSGVRHPSWVNGLLCHPHSTPFAIARLGCNGCKEYLRIPSPTPYVDIIVVAMPNTAEDPLLVSGSDVVSKGVV